MKKKICFRADASATIGYGHFVRTLALADMLKESFDCVFYTSEPTPYQIAEMEKVCPFVALQEDAKFETFLDLLDGNEIVVLDNYFFTTDYQREIKAKGCKLVCIDDMHNKHYVADAVINHGKPSLEEFDCEPYTKLYIGDGYKLLRKPFLSKYEYRQRNNVAIVNLGGADPYRLTDRIVSLLIQTELPYKIVVILGDKVYLSEQNRKMVETRSNLTAEQMAGLFETSAFAILPASTVSIEAASRGIPRLTGYQADNQEEGYKKALAKGLFIPLGDLRTITCERLFVAINQLKGFIPIIPDYSKVPINYKKLFKSL